MRLLVQVSGEFAVERVAASRQRDQRLVGTGVWRVAGFSREKQEASIKAAIPGSTALLVLENGTNQDPGIDNWLQPGRVQCKLNSSQDGNVALSWAKGVASSKDQAWLMYFTDPTLWDGRSKKLGFDSPAFSQREALWTDSGWVEEAVRESSGTKVGVMESGNEFRLFDTNRLMDMYVKRGSVMSARHLFDDMSERNVVSWNVMIMGYAKKGDGVGALGLYVQMLQEGFEPDDRTFVGTLKACSGLAGGEERTEVDGRFVKAGCLEKGRAIHSQAVKRGFEADVFVGNTLIDMYVKCGSIMDVRQVFDRLPHRDVVSWTSMILGYAQREQGEIALQMYAQMQQEGVVPNNRTFVGTLKACGSLTWLGEGTEIDGGVVDKWCLEKGRAIHTQAAKRGFESDVFVGNTFIDVCVKCGSTMDDARQVFDRLPRRDVVSWTAMILGYAQKEQGESALQMYASMQQEGVAPNDRTFVGTLKACSSLAVLEEGTEVDGKCVKMQCLEKGRAIHSQVVKAGFESDVFVGSTLVDMYVKCGSIEEAWLVFDKLYHRNVVSWTAMILGYAEKEEGEVALQLYARMQMEGIAPDYRTFVCALKACSKLASPKGLEKGRAIHSQVVKSGVECVIFVGNALMDMYANCGSVVDARQVFDKLPHRNVVSWNTMILGYSDKEEAEECLHMYARMHQEGVQPDDRTLVGALKACSSLAALEEGRGVDGKLLKVGCLEKGRGIHIQAVKSGFEWDMFVGNTLIDMYVKCGSVVDAWNVFHKLPHRDVVSWNAMILGYAQMEEGEVALELYARMQWKGVEADGRTFVGALKACSSLAAVEEGKPMDGKLVKVECLEKGRSIHSRVVDGGFFDHDVFVGTTLVDMYAKCGSIMDARNVFDMLPSRDVVSWNAMILGCAEQGQSEEAFKLFAQMQEQGVAASRLTFVSILKACGNMSALEAGKEIHARIRRLGLESSTVVATTLMDMYGKCGSMVDAQRLFNAAFSTRDLVTWNALIAGYARHGDSEVVFAMVERMRQEGIQPDGVTFLSILTACSHVGLVKEGEKYFEAMGKDYGITPSIQHYNCMVDLVGRAGQVQELLAMVNKMPYQPNLITWRTVLAACRKWNNAQVGKEAFEHMMRLDHGHSSAYVLMSNIYADAQMWEERDKIQARRMKGGAWKKPGQSWSSDMDGLVHTFVVGDVKHPDIMEIRAKLQEMCVQMKEEGYVHV